MRLVANTLEPIELNFGTEVLGPTISKSRVKPDFGTEVLGPTISKGRVKPDYFTLYVNV